MTKPTKLLQITDQLYLKGFIILYTQCPWSYCMVQLVYLDMEFQVFIHGVNVVKYVLYYTWNDSHSIWVMQITLETHNLCILSMTDYYARLSAAPQLQQQFTSIVCVFPDEVCP